MMRSEIESAMKFSSNMANSYAEQVAIKQDSIAEKKAKKLIKYIESKYEGNIKNSIMKNRNLSYVDIKLPLFSRIKNDRIYDKVAKIVEHHFTNLGFRTFMKRGEKCTCAFDCICNNRAGTLRLFW